jgi:hypothetical protein
MLAVIRPVGFAPVFIKGGNGDLVLLSKINIGAVECVVQL